PVHGSAPNIAGKGIANPLGSVLSAAMMLGFLGWKKESEVVGNAVKAALLNNYLTSDLGGDRGTKEVGDWLENYVVSHGSGLQVFLRIAFNGPSRAMRRRDDISSLTFAVRAS